MVMISRRGQLNQSEVLSFDSSQACINSVQYYYAIKKLLEYIACPNCCSWWSFDAKDYKPNSYGHLETLDIIRETINRHTTLWTERLEH